VSVLNVFKIGIAFVFIAAGYITIHVALDLLYFGQVYLEHLL
jgi:hypothetical protein